LVQGQGLGHDYPNVVPNYPSKLEGRERTPGDVPVLAVPQANTPLVNTVQNQREHGIDRVVVMVGNRHYLHSTY
jgi:pantothenate kinase type III